MKAVGLSHAVYVPINELKETKSCRELLHWVLSGGCNFPKQTICAVIGQLCRVIGLTSIIIRIGGRRW